MTELARVITLHRCDDVRRELGIESGIPLKIWKKKSRTRDQLQACRVGDSFLVKTNRGKKSVLYHFAKKLGIKVACRVYGRHIRVWRVA